MHGERKKFGGNWVWEHGGEIRDGKEFCTFMSSGV